MTNEEMATLIQSGKNELFPLLWKRVSRLCAQLACRYYNRNSAVCVAAGVTDDDLMQEAYFGFAQAVNSYRSESGHLFTTHLHYPLLNCFRAATGGRTTKGKQEPLHHAISLNTPVGEDDSLMLEDTQQDETALEPFEKIEITDIQRIVREEIALLPDKRQRDAIMSYYFYRQTYRDISSRYGVTIEQVRQIIQTAFRKLRKGKRMRELYRDFYSHSDTQMLDRIIYSPEYFDLIAQIRERQKREYISYGKQQAMLYQFMQGK